ncbi:MAG: hypothetical protein Q4B26_00345 [Eubacteriales bacterium]|nr:hypothetical protein [Eubacteriales bacterium]
MEQEKKKEKKTVEVPSVESKATAQSTPDVGSLAGKKQVTGKTMAKSLGGGVAAMGKFAAMEVYRDTKQIAKDGVKKLENTGKKATETLMHEAEQGR